MYVTVYITVCNVLGLVCVCDPVPAPVPRMKSVGSGAIPVAIPDREIVSAEGFRRLVDRVLSASVAITYIEDPFAWVRTAAGSELPAHWMAVCTLTHSLAHARAHTHAHTHASLSPLCWVLHFGLDFLLN